MKRLPQSTLLGAALFSATVLGALLGAGAAQAEAKLTLTYIADPNWVKEPEKALAKKFEEQTGIAIDFQLVPSDQYFNLLKTKLNSGEAPDLFGGQSGVTDLTINYNVEKNAVDLSGDPWAKAEDPLVAAQATVNGKLYGLTYWDTLGYVWVVNYNKKLFAEHGLKEPATFADFKAACATLLAAGVQPIYEPAADGWHQVLWFPELGPRYEQATPGLAAALNANKATFAGNATMTTALSELKELYDAGYFGEDTLSDTWANRTAALAEGKVAMILATSSYAAELAKDHPEMKAEDIGVFVMPLADNQLLNVNPAGPTHFISATSKNIDAAKQYLDFLTQPENLQYYLDNEPAFLTLPFPGVKDKFSAELQAFMAAHATARGTVYQTEVNYVNAQWMDIGKDITAMFTGAEAPEDVLKNIDKRRADLATAAKDPAWVK
jgi:raffinose/stachyose/melibiose transport system substrate-binding protein